MSDQKVCPTCGTEYPLSERFCPRDGTALRSSNAQGDLMGSIIAERYHVLKKLGEGGMGTVYLAEHVKMGRKAALKVMNPGMNQDPDAIARFNREAANASRLNHPNVCGIYDFGETPEGLIYLAMEFIEGESLTSLIEKNGALPAPRAASIIHQAADALGVAHDYGIVHRDLKPDNIMIAKGRDGSDHVKVVDFGIAKASSSDAQKVTKTGLVVGTPEYMSPEQLAGDKLDGRSDIYSLGLVAFNCLTGKLPFPSNSAQEAMIMRLTDQPKTLAEMKPDIEWPPELQAVMDRALARDADERYQKAAEFGRDMAKAVENMPHTLAAAAGTQVIGAPPAAIPATRVASAGAGGRTKQVEAPPAAVAAPAKKSSGALIAGGVVVVLGLAVGGVLMLNKGGASAVPPPVGQANTTADPAANGGGTPAADSKKATAVSSQVPVNASGSKVLPMSKTATPAAGGSAGTEAPVVTSNPASAADHTTDLDELKKLTDPATADPSSANRAISKVDKLLPSLAGLEKAQALYYKGMANLILDNAPDACRLFASALVLAKGSSLEGSIKAFYGSSADKPCQ